MPYTLDPPAVLDTSSGETQATRSVVFHSPVEGMSKSDIKDVNEEIPSFFGVLYPNQKLFRMAVEDATINEGVHLEQAEGFQGSTRCGIKCKHEGCDFFVFAKMKTSPLGKGLLALADDKTTSKGKVLKQNFHHSAACKLSSTGRTTGKVRRVSKHRDIQEGGVDRCSSSVQHNHSTLASKKVCVLTGASGVIGYAIAKALKGCTAHQWHIIIIGRRPPPESITNMDGKPIPVLPYDTFLEISNLTDEKLVISTLNSHFMTLRYHKDPVIKTLDRLDLLVNCAGCSLGNEPIVNVSADTFRSVLEINVVTPFILSKWALAKFANQDDNSFSRIINIGSIACESPRLHMIPYATSKFALTGLTRAFSLDGRNLGRTTMTGTSGMVAVCQINPGNVRSNIMSPDEMARREIEEGFVEPDEVGMYVANVANMPNTVNVLESTVMPTRQPLVGRG